MISAFGIEHTISKSDFPTAVVRGAKNFRRNKPGKLRLMKEMGARHKAQGGALHEEVNRPPHWKPNMRRAWDQGFGKSFLGASKMGTIAKPARLLTPTERATVKNRIVGNKKEAADWGVKSGDRRALHTRGTPNILRSGEGRKVYPQGPAFGSKKQTTQWNAPTKLTTTTSGQQTTAGGSAWKTNRKKGAGVIQMNVKQGGNVRGTPASSIHSHEQAHLAVKRNPIRAKERFQNPARKGGEEGRADFGNPRAEPYPGSPEFRGGYEQVQRKMAAAKKRKGQNPVFHPESRSWR